MRWTSWTTLGLGLWLIIAPFTLGYADLAAAVFNDRVLGAIIMGLSASELVARGRRFPATTGWITAIAALRLIVAPFQFGYLGGQIMYVTQDHMPLPYLAGYGAAATAGINDVIVGFVVLVASVARALAPLAHVRA